MSQDNFWEDYMPSHKETIDEIAQLREKDAEIIRLRARLAEVEAAKAVAWDEAMSVVIAALPGFSATHQDGALLRAEIMSAPCFVNVIRALVNPYRSKNDEPQ